MTDILLQRGPDPTGYRLSTANQSFERIREGEDPWIAFGDFLDDWRRAESDQIAALIADPIKTNEADPLRRWAALFVAAIDWLCYILDEDMAPPDWIADEVYVLPEPWFVIEHKAMRAWQLEQSPAPFRMRRIYTDASIVSRA